MCGICGELALGARPVDPGGLEPMLAAMTHRGPDADGRILAPAFAGGIRRLAVIDPAGGNQPIANEDESVQVIFNGEIYNFDELRQELSGRGHRWRTRCDTEVLVHLWEEYGREMVHRLNGMFAFAIRDERKGETFIARDRLGIKPLFYQVSGDRLFFASELRVLLQHPQVVAEIDGAALVDLFLLQFVAGHRTVYRGIDELPPGHTIHVREGRLEIDRYYRLPGPSPRLEASQVELVDELQELLRDSVRKRRVSDVPLGVFLSGGIDSGVILRLLSGMVDLPVKTFSVGFDDAGALDERKHAARVARHFEADHHELVVSALDIAGRLPQLVAHLAQPVMDPAMIPTHILSEFARRDVTVVLTGEGADELFGGYRRYLYQKRYGALARLPGARGLRVFGDWLPHRAAQALWAMGQREPQRIHLGWASTIGPSVAARLFEQEAHRDSEFRIDRQFRAYFPEHGLRLGDSLHADQLEWLPRNLLAKVDLATMAYSLEARVPFLDHRLVEWAAGVPDDLKIRGRTTKYLLREAFRSQLPPGIADRPKRGFDLPLASWIRGPLRELVGDLLDPRSLARWGELDVPFARQMLEQHLKGRQDYGLPLFNLLSVMLFFEQR